jgi:predicted membrane channel-forming protein YqfA (hemolysin III family)
MMTLESDDEQHLRLLGIFHYVVGALTALFALFPLIHFSLGLFFVLAPPHSTQQQGGPPPAIIGWFFMIIGGMFFLLGESFAGCVFAAGRFIRCRRRYWFVFVVACLQCAFFPFGTALGVFTIVILSRPSVKEIFGLGVSEQPPTT